MATDAILEGVPMPKVEIPNVSKGTVKAAEKQLDRAERVAGENPRPSRSEAVKESKKKVENLKKKKKNVDNANKAVNDVKDAAAKEATNRGLEKAWENYKFEIKQ